MNKNKIYFIILSIITPLIIYLSFNISVIPILVRTFLLFGILSIYYLILYFFILKDRCQICGGKLEDTFPKDFPKEFKICCGCLKVAEIIYLKDCNKEDSIMKRRLAYKHYKYYKNKFDNLFRIRKEKLELIKNEC